MFAITRLAALAVVASCLSLTSACAAAPSTGTKNVSPSALRVASPADAIGFSAWVVPITARSFYLQVRLSPRLPIARAVLTVVAPGIQISPERIILTDLKPSPALTTPHSPPNPPALGMTVLRTFRLVASAPGTYRVVVRLSFLGTSKSQIVNLISS